VKIEILNPIEHDGKRFERGIIELGEELAKIFLKFKYAAREMIEKVEAQLESGATTAAPAAPASAPHATPTTSATHAPAPAASEH